MLSIDTWVGGSSGDWSNAANWSAGVPISTSDVQIAAGVTVTVSTGFQSANTVTTDPTDTLSINGGSLTIGASSTIAGSVNLSNGGTLDVGSGATLTLAGATNQWSTGTVGGSFAGSGSGILSVGAGLLSIGSGGATFDFPVGMFNWSNGTIASDSSGTPSVLNNTGAMTLTSGATETLEFGLTLNNSGTITDSGSGRWNFNDTTVLINQSGGLVEMTSSAQLGNGNSTANFYNDAGAIFESSSSSGTVVNLQFDNQGGTVAATAGTLSFAGGGSDTGGSYNPASGAKINFTGLSTITGTYAGSGAGTVLLSNGGLAVGPGGATLNFPAGMFQWSGGDFSLAAGGGPLNNTGALTLTGANFSYLSNLVLNNSGTITDSSSQNLAFENGAITNNLSGGLFDITNGGEFSAPNSAEAFNNEAGATFEDTGTAASNITVSFNNQGGTVAATAGTLDFVGGGTDTGGTYNASTGATVYLNSANPYNYNINGTPPTLTGTYTGSGGGTVSVGYSNNIAIGAAGATFDFSGGLFQLQGGTITGSGSSSSANVLANIGAMTLAGGTTNNFLANGLIVNNSGTIVDTNSTGLYLSNNAVINNLSGGLFNITGGGGLANAGSATAFNNETGATFENTGAINSINNAPFNNQGGTVAAMAGTLSFVDGGTDTGGIYNASAGATIDLNDNSSGAAPTLTGTYTGSGSGTVNVSNQSSTSAIIVGAAGATFNFPTGLFNWSNGEIEGSGSPTSPAVLTNTGTIRLTGSQTQNLSNGIVLNNSGTIVDNGTECWQFASYAVLNNLSGGVVSMAASDSISVNGSSSGIAINNELGATFECSANAGPFVDVPFNNQGGTVSATAGVLNFADGGTSTGGVYNASSGALIDLNDGGTAPTLTGTYTGTGAGMVGVISGTLDIAGTAASPTVFNFNTAPFYLAGATLAGSGTLANTGSVTIGAVIINGLQRGNNTAYISQLELNNSGTIAVGGTSQTWELEGNSVVNNLSGGMVNTNGNSLSDPDYTCNFNNQAASTFESSGSTVSVPFNNQGGTVATTGNYGSLAFTGGGTDTGGVYNAATGTAIDLNYSTGYTTFGAAPTLTGSYTGSGGGTVGWVGISVLNFPPIIYIGAAGATFNFPAGLFNWSAGFVASSSTTGPATITNTGFITVSGSGTKEAEHGLALNNSGTIVDNGSGVWEFVDTSALNNLSGGLVNLASTEGISSGYGGINNQLGATFESTSSSGVGVSGLFNNYGGTVASTAATLDFYGGGTDTGGIFDASTGATINLNYEGGSDYTNGPAPTLTGTYTGSGGGTVAVTGQAFFGFPALEIGAAGATFNFPAGLLQWSSGEIASSAGSSNNVPVLTNTGTMTLTTLRGTPGGQYLETVALNNSGTIVDTSAVPWSIDYNGVLNNLAGGLVDIASTSPISSMFSATGVAINNEAGATFESTSASGTSVSVPLNNVGGTVAVSTGTLTLSSVPQATGTALTGGIWEASGTGATAGDLVLPGGIFTESDGSVILSGNGTFPQMDALANNVGSFSLLSGANFTTAGNFASPGSLMLGAGSTLNITGTTTFSANSSLNIQIGGTPASGQFGQLNAASSATLAGVLDVSLANSYVPASGQTYQVVSSPLLGGAFSSVSVPSDSQSNPYFGVTTGSTAVTLNALALTPLVTPSGSAANYTTRAAAIAVDPDVTVAGVPANLSGATVTITNSQAGDHLNFVSQNGISGYYSGGSLALSGTATIARYQQALQSVTFSNPTNPSTVARKIAIVANNGSLASNTASETINVSSPITVSGAWVMNPSWGSSGSTNFLGYLASHSLGSATLGYALKTGASQLTVLPWANINTISVQFSAAVSNIGLGSLALVGGTGDGATGAATAPPSVTGFTSDGNNTYSWTLSANLTNNKYVFAIATTGSSFGTPGSTQVTDANGAGISGSFTTGSSTFPSGNGLAGSTFDFAFNVLPGDGLQNGIVSVASTSAAKALNNDKETAAAYNPYFDYNGAGIITVIDASLGAADNNDKQSSITAPAAPSASQGGGSAGSAGFAALALAVQETSSTGLTAGDSTTSTTGSISNFSSASNESTVTPAAASPATATTGSGTRSGTTATAPSHGGHGRHQFAAVDAALPEFDLVELWV